MRPLIKIVLIALVNFVPATAEEIYTHFEGRQTHPIQVSIDGTRLLALNTPGARLSVFAINDRAAQNPILIAEIPVGLEPVSLAQNPERPDEIWVVNEVSDSVTIVSLSKRVAIAHLPTPDEPADVVFAGSRAFVSCAQNRRVLVFDSLTRERLKEIVLECLMPRAMAASPVGSSVFVASLFSGNRTTILPHTMAPPPPIPTNPDLPPAPDTGLIVKDSHESISYTVIDNDIAEIDVESLEVRRYIEGIGTNLFDIAINPGETEIWATNTEALNHIRFEPELRGHFVDNRVTRASLSVDAVESFDLNRGIDYSLLPNPEAQLTAIAQPVSLLFEPDGEHLWIASFGSDHVAKVHASDGTVVSRVDVGSALADGKTSDPSAKRGPRGLASSMDEPLLYVLNRLSNSVSTIDKDTSEVVHEVPTGSFDPTPQEVKEGRGFLFDARLSGNGTASCASCHLDGDRDGIAWDLGDPGGEMVYIDAENRVNHDLVGNDQVPSKASRELHPMKGPKVTQTLRGMTIDPETIADAAAPSGTSVRTPLFHWRGDRKSLHEFNATFDNLMGGTAIADAEFEKIISYLKSLKPHPNPHRNLDRSAPDELANGSPSQGRLNFLNHGLSHCAVCHSLPSGTDHNIDEFNNSSVVDFVKSPSLLQSYQKEGIFTPSKERSLSGFGFGHDGTGSSLPLPHFYFLSVMDVPQLIDTRAFVLSFDSITTGTAPAVGHTLTVTADSSGEESVRAQLNILESHTDPAAASFNQYWNDLVVTGSIDDQPRALRFDSANKRYVFDSSSQPPITQEALLESIASGDFLTFIGLPTGYATQFGGDLNRNDILDTDELPPEITVHNDHSANLVQLRWTGSQGWFVEISIRDDAGIQTWEPATIGTLTSPSPGRFQWEVNYPQIGVTREFWLRLRRTW